VLPLAATLVDDDVFVAFVEGFAAFGSCVAFFSSLAGFAALVYRNSSEEIGQAVNYGIAIGFVPGLALAADVVIEASTKL
jgi:hypothetical protein